MYILSMPKGIFMFALTLEALYERSWTGPMLFAMDCSTVITNQVLAFTKACSTLSTQSVLSVDHALCES